MDSTAELIRALADLLWPLMVLVVILRFSPAVGQIIASARDRKFTLKVGGQELTMEEVREQQSDLIADLQAQVAELMAKGSSGEVATAAGTTLEPTSPRTGEGDGVERAGGGDSMVGATGGDGGAPRVLWVDDEPRNNSLLVETLGKGGIQVELALSTADGLSRVQRGSYRAVITDLGRKEGNTFNQEAGLQLLEEIRRLRPDLPVVIFTSANGARRRRGDAERLGAALVTASATELVGFVRTQARRSPR